MMRADSIRWKILGPVCLLFCIVLTPFGSAHGASVFLSSQLTALGGRGVSCTVVNGGKKDAQVVIEVIEYNGAVAFSGLYTVPPGEGRSARAVGGNVNYPYCRVTITQGSKNKIRAVLCVHEGFSTLESPCIATSEAR